MTRLTHILTTAALVVAVSAVPALAAPYEQLNGEGGFRTTYQPASDAGGQDLRSPDAVDAAANRGIYSSDDKHPYALNRDYGSPDAVDAARDLPPVQTPVLAAHDVPSSGFDWGDAGIGAAGMFGLFGIAAACALMLTTRRRRDGLRPSTR
jgi:hypothetical protein